MEFSFVNHQIGIIIFLSACLLILITNLMALHQLGSESLEVLSDPDSMPLTSILIPARNEEVSIRDCVVSLLEQDYPNIEIIVLDDHSTDNTAKILSELAITTSKLKIIEGKEIPPGWLGKNWACNQLGELSQGSILLFTDADTHHEPKAVREAVSTMIAQRLDFLSALPFQIVETLGEKLLVSSLVLVYSIVHIT
jgi:chlorobactene glucosyltransferase